MNYYQHHIGDYRRDTAHLSLLEHGVYRQLLDMYYLSETKIPAETEVVYRRLCAKTDEEKKAVDTVLSEFFKLENGWIQTRCDKEISEYHGKAGRARENGKLGGRPSKTKVVISNNPEVTEAKANHKPLTINHKPLIEREIAARATRLPQNFFPEIEPEAESGIDRKSELSKFTDYWTAKSGKDATKLDWQATWRNWCRNARRNPADVARITVPGPKGQDPELERIKRERASAAPMPDNVREKIAALLPRRVSA